jgi:RNA polymerase sigma factor (sigma-70 family)
MQENMLPDEFAPTQWTLVMRSRGHTTQARMALGQLCENYYHPVHRFIRAQTRNDAEAQDLTHDFFARLLERAALDGVSRERGRFRSYLLGAVKNFLAEHHRRHAALKRGGGEEHISLQTGGPDGEPLDLCCETDHDDVRLFDREWADTIVNRAVSVLTAEYQSAGKQKLFDALKPWLLGEDEDASRPDMAKRLDMTEGALKVALHRLRKRMREQVKAEIAQTVESEAEIRDEMRYLIEVLSHRPSGGMENIQY